MKKIPTLYVRDFAGELGPPGRYVHTNQVTPGCEWVIAGEGLPTRKYDGTCVMHDDAGWWARREVKPGKTAPPWFTPIDVDEKTSKQVGWEPIEQSSFFKMFCEACDPHVAQFGTYELCGPKINGNPEGYVQHRLIRHADATRMADTGITRAEVVATMPVAYEPFGVHEVLIAGIRGWEGLVWHHPDGRMAKLKVRDLLVASRIKESA